MTSKEKEQEAERLRAKQRQQLNEAKNTPKQEDVADTRLAEIAKQGGALGKKLEREIRQFQQTGRVSSWLSGETLKSEAAQNAAQQSSFSNTPRLPPSRQETSIPLANTNNTTKFGPKPELRDAVGKSDCVGLVLYAKTISTDNVATTQVWISAGTVAGVLPSGFDPAEGKFIASDGSGYVWAEVNIDGTTGDIVSVDVNGGGPTPNNTNTSFYSPLGYYVYNGNSASVNNYGCGSVNAIICRNWFAAASPFYDVPIHR